MQNHQSSQIGSGGVVYCFHDRFLLLESVIVSILKGVYCLFFSRSTMSGNFPSDEVGKSYRMRNELYLISLLAREGIVNLIKMVEIITEKNLESGASSLFSRSYIPLRPGEIGWG